MSIVKLNNNGVKNVTAFGSITTSGAMTFIKKLTASSSGTLSFVDGSSDVVLDNTYKEYLFTFKDIHPATDNVKFQFQGSTNTGSSYGVTITNTYHRAYHQEDGDPAVLAYEGTFDQAQSTAFANLVDNLGADNDQTCSGSLTIYNPSSTTFVKHFMSRLNNYHQNEYSMDQYSAGYFNTTSAIDAVQFKMSSGNIDAGDICLYGIN